MTKSQAIDNKAIYICYGLLKDSLSLFSKGESIMLENLIGQKVVFRQQSLPVDYGPVTLVKIVENPPWRHIKKWTATIDQGGKTLEIACWGSTKDTLGMQIFSPDGNLLHSF